MPGTFLNFYLPFSQNGKTVSSRDQAQTILIKAEELMRQGYIGVAITYSAKYDQTLRIAQVYNSGGWRTNTNGANQASVMHEMELLLDKSYAALQGKMRIAPITTMNGYNYPVHNWSEEMQLSIVRADLNEIKSLLNKNWCVLGWQNQITLNDTLHPYAIGGGVANLPDKVDALIQRILTEFAEQE